MRSNNNLASRQVTGLPLEDELFLDKKDEIKIPGIRPIPAVNLNDDDFF